MKTFTIATLAALLANYGASAISCSTTKTADYPLGQPCPDNMKCVMMTQDQALNADMPSKGVCKYNTDHGGIDYNRANRAFTTADIDHNRKITFGGAYKALSSLEPRATEAMLDKLTKTGDKNKNGFIDYSEFVAMYRVLEDMVKNKGNPNSKCAAKPCASGQLCRNCKNIKGYCCENISTVPASTTGPTGELTKEERAQVNNIFTALNTNKDKGVSYQEFYQLLMAVRNTMSHSSKLYSEVYQYIYRQGDTNHDKILEYSEFVKACTTLKAKDPVNFPQFLKSISQLKPLVLNDRCVRWGSNQKPCPEGSSCQAVSVQKTYKSSGSGSGTVHTYTSQEYICLAVTTTQKPVTDVKAGQPCTYGYCKSGCRHCAKGLQCRAKAVHFGQTQQTNANGICTPSNCKDCTTAKGTWMGNKCVFGSPGVADGVMFTSPKQCQQYDAAKHAQCTKYKDCKTCVTKGTDAKLGPLCAWTSNWGSRGSCQRNTGGGMMMQITATKQCPKPVVVNGRE